MSKPITSGQHESLANFAKRDALRSVTKDSLEALDGFPQWLETEPERLMVHRHDESRAGCSCHRHCLLRRAVRLDPGIVRPDRHDREIDFSIVS